MTEFVTADDGVKLAFERVGSGAPVLLVHGFGSSRGQNWKSTGWYSSLTEAGFGVVAMDCRGHGQSDKPHDPAFYGHVRMAEDAATVMDAVGFKAAPLIGYSMGGFIGLRLVAAHPQRVTRLALCGVGEYYLRGPRIADKGARSSLADALLTDDPAGITDKRGRMFRSFADQPGKDRFALAACMMAMSPQLPMEELAAVRQPVLVVCGELDDLAGPPGPLAAAFPLGRAVTIPGRDHMSAVGDPKTRQAVVEFLLAAQADILTPPVPYAWDARALHVSTPTFDAAIAAATQFPFGRYHSRAHPAPACDIPYTDGLPFEQICIRSIVHDPHLRLLA